MTISEAEFGGLPWYIRCSLRGYKWNPRWGTFTLPRGKALRAVRRCLRRARRLSHLQATQAHKEFSEEQLATFSDLVDPDRSPGARLIHSHISVVVID